MEQTLKHTVPAEEAGIPRRAYVQLVLLGAMIPVEAVTMLKWSGPAGALLIGGTVAASLTSEMAPRAWNRLRRTDSPGQTTEEDYDCRFVLRLSPMATGPEQGQVPVIAMEAALRRACRQGDSVSVGKRGDSLVELPGCTRRQAEGVGRRMALAVRNRLAIEVSAQVEERKPAEKNSVMMKPRSAVHADLAEEVVDGYSLRRDIFRGEPTASTRGNGQLFRKARATLHFVAA